MYDVIKSGGYVSGTRYPYLGTDAAVEWLRMCGIRAYVVRHRKGR